MHKKRVSIVSYEKPIESVRKAIDLSNGLINMPPKAKVFIKPNIVFWTKAAAFPKWGVITTSRVVEDMIIILKEHGIDDITIAEGGVTFKPKDTKTYAHAFEALGYGTLKRRYGIKYIDIMQRPFAEVDLGAGVVLNHNVDILDCDFVVNLPVLKTHSQARVSLGIKNLKGLIDIPSRKKCHEESGDIDLDYMIARLANKIPPSMTLIDGIYSLELGPLFTGNARRRNLLVASADILAADMVGSRLLGFDPTHIPHLVHAAKDRRRALDLSDVEITGESIEKVAQAHEWEFPYTEDGALPLPLAKKGMQGLAYRKYDKTLCTYCSLLPNAILWGLYKGWRGEAWNGVEVLSGKVMPPTPGMKKTILLGQCMYDRHKDHADIQEMISVKGCPPQPKAIVRAFQQAGVKLDATHLENLEQFPAIFMKRYAGKSEFDESFYIRCSPL